MAVLLIVLAGCSGLNGGAPSTQPTDPTSTVATSNNTVNYTELSDTEQQAFDAAQQRSTGFAPISVRESLAINQTYFPLDAQDVFQNHEYVQKNGSYYQISWDGHTSLATYEIRVTEQQPSENASVVALGNLSSEVREPVQKAIENGSYETPYGKWYSLPESLHDSKFVRANGTYYKTRFTVGDFWNTEMRAEPVK